MFWLQGMWASPRFQHIVQAENVTLFDRVVKVFSPQKGILHSNLHEDYLVVLPWQEAEVRHGQTERNSAKKLLRQTHTRYDADRSDHFCCRLGADQYCTAQLIKRKMTF